MAHPWANGYVDYETGKIYDNPYEEDSDEYAEYQAGYNTAIDDETYYLESQRDERDM